MSKNSKKKTPRTQYVALASMFLVGAALGLFTVLYVENSSTDEPAYKTLLSYAVLLGGIYVANFFHIIVHEAGHLVFGLLSGYKFVSFRVLSFTWVKENDKIKFRRIAIAGTAGQCLMSPPDMKDGKFPVALINFGGVIFNAIFSVLFLIGYFLFSSYSYLNTLLLVFTIFGFVLVIFNGVPLRMGGVDNDGYNAISLSKNEKALEAFWLQLKMVELQSMGLRIKDMPAEWFSVPSDEDMKNNMVAARGVFACNRLMDEERFEEADALMAHILDIDSGAVGIYSNLLTCDRIFVELISENRRDVIEDMLSKELTRFMKTMKNYPSILRTEYSLALLFENDAKKADKIKAQFDKASRKYPYQQEIQPEKAMMDLAQEKYQATVT
ncbi:MAG: M50 family metallopeptidase [Clostridia bacterium]|nr:M50 family metallopeptidase [Clostridia bacterium]